MTKVLMISNDRKILEEGSPARARMEEYGRLFEELHIVVFAKSGFQFPFAKIEIAKNTYAYPTRSFSKILYINDAIKIGRSIVESWDASLAVITTQDPFETGFVGRRISQRSGIPLHVQIHTDILSPYFKGESMLNRLRLAVSKGVLAHAKAIRAVSERVRRSMKDERVAVLPIYTDISAIKQMPVPVGFKTTNAKFERTVLVASRLSREKDVGTAIRAFASIKDPAVGLFVVGSGPELPKLKKLVRTLGIEERVEFAPWMDRAELVSHMKISDVFLSSSLYEGYGLSMLEAHSAGVTIAATDAGLAPLLVHDKNIASPKDFLGLAGALKNALSGSFTNKDYSYPYTSKDAYLLAFKSDIERSHG